MGSAWEVLRGCSFVSSSGNRFGERIVVTWQGRRLTISKRDICSEDWAMLNSGDDFEEPFDLRIRKSLMQNLGAAENVPETSFERMAKAMVAKAMAAESAGSSAP